MADITLCSNHKTNGCKLSDKCKRVTAKPSDYWQSYSDFTFWGNECNGFYQDESMEDKLDAKNQEIRDRMKDVCG